jgi:hypothetical protein
LSVVRDCLVRLTTLDFGPTRILFLEEVTCKTGWTTEPKVVVSCYVVVAAQMVKGATRATATLPCRWAERPRGEQAPQRSGAC